MEWGSCTYNNRYVLTIRNSHLHTHTLTKNNELFKCKTVEKIQELVRDGAKVDAQKADSSTPLIVHSAAGNRAVVGELVRLRANVDLQDNEGWSALMVASREGYVEIVQALVCANAIVDLKNKEVHIVRS